MSDYEYQVNIGNESYDSRHKAVGQLAKYMRDDAIAPNPYHAGSLVRAVPTDTDK